jgi:hypothetical protein
VGLCARRPAIHPQQNLTPGQQADTVYKIVNVLGVSETSGRTRASFRFDTMPSSQTCQATPPSSNSKRLRIAAFFVDQVKGASPTLS